MQGYGRLIREARDALGLTQEEAGDLMGTSASTISNLEREQHLPTIPDQVNALAIHLRVPAASLLEKMGVTTLSIPLEGRLPRDTVLALLDLTPEELATLTRLAQVMPATRSHALR